MEKVIFHIDVNSAFLSFIWTMRFNSIQSKHKTIV